MFLTLISKKKNRTLNSKKGHILSVKKKKGTPMTYFTIKVPFFLICPFLLFSTHILSFVKGGRSIFNIDSDAGLFLFELISVL